jgi:hypothetical protein
MKSPRANDEVVAGTRQLKILVRDKDESLFRPWMVAWMDSYSGVVECSTGSNPSLDLILDAFKTYLRRFGTPKAVCIPDSFPELENLCDTLGIEIRVKTESHPGLEEFFNRLETEGLSGMPGTWK